MQKLTIIAYHYIRPIKESKFPLIKGLELESFKFQLDYLEKNYKFITMESLIDFAKTGKQIPNNSCLLTFDDGYKDHYLYVYPELKRRGIQGSFFAVASTILERKILDVNKIHFILAKESKTNLIIDDIKKLIIEYKKSNDEINNFDYYWNKYAVANKLDTKEIVFVKRILQRGLPEPLRLQFCTYLFERYVGRSEKEFALELYLSEMEIKEMIKSNMYFGSHGHNHPWLNSLPKSLQHDEIKKGLDFLNYIGAPTKDWVMNYPYGAYNSDTLEILKEKNCLIGLTMKMAVAELKSDQFLELPRFRTNDFPSN
jgi:hypothetical protein